jgi:hypothetical protein
MPDNDAAILKALKSKINKLVKVVLDEATLNSDFRQKLENALLEPSSYNSSSKAAKSVTKISKLTKAKEKINLVSFLQENGKERLADELSLKTDTELKAILRTERIKEPRELKTIERQQMIDAILKNASQNLNQGIRVSGISKK